MPELMYKNNFYTNKKFERYKFILHAFRLFLLFLLYIFTKFEVVEDIRDH